MQALLQKYGVTIVAIAPYASRSNSIVERAIREVRRHIHTFAQQGRQWPDVVKHVQFIINRSVHSVTGFAPADILFGQINALGFGAATPIMEALTNDLNNDDSEEEDRRESSITRRESNVIPPMARDLAANMRQQSDFQAQVEEHRQARISQDNSTMRRGPAAPKVGDRVWVRVRVINKTSSREHWTGPAEIIAIAGNSNNGTEIFTVRMQDGGEQRVSLAKLRRIPRGVTLEGRTEGAEIIGTNSWEPGKAIEFYQLRVRHPNGDQTWEQASAWLRRPEFQLYALTEPHLNHLVFRDA